MTAPLQERGGEEKAHLGFPFRGAEVGCAAMRGSMRKARLPAIAALLLLSVPCLAGMGGRIEWGTDYSEGLDAALRRKRPMIVYFTTSW